MPRKSKGPSGEELPPGLYWDGRSFRIQPAPGVPRERAGVSKGRALQLLKQRRAELRSGTYRPRKSRRPKTLDELEARWYAHQPPSEYLPIAHSQYLRCASPQLGKRDPDTIRPHEILDAVWELYRSRAAKTAHNLFVTLSSVYTFGVFHELCETNACRSVPSKKLPPIGKQKRPAYTDTEALRLIAGAGDSHWRVLYALEGFAGLRHGEACGRRWKDIDWDAPVLPSIHVHSQYQDLRLKTARGDDLRARLVPVHPELGRILREWKLGGWAKRYGRHPGPDDFIIPSPSSMKAYARKSVALKRPPKDCALVGIEAKGHHGLRRFFVTYCRRGGAAPDLLSRITHGESASMIDVYTDGEGLWPRLCETMKCLKVTWPQTAHVLRLATDTGTDTD